MLPADQADFLTATKFVNALIKNGVSRASRHRAVHAAGKPYPAGSYVVKTAQAFRPHVLDMFEPQDHPNDFQFPGGPPIPPYDNAGWTLAYQMGVKFDRVLEGVDGPLEALHDLVKPAPGAVDRRGRRGRLTSSITRHNDAFIAVNRLLKAGEEVLLRRRPQLAERRRHRRDVRAGQDVDVGGAAEGGRRTRLDVPRRHRHVRRA